jgi:hypothetical protein
MQCPFCYAVLLATASVNAEDRVTCDGRDCGHVILDGQKAWRCERCDLDFCEECTGAEGGGGMDEEGEGEGEGEEGEEGEGEGEEEEEGSDAEYEALGSPTRRPTRPGTPTSCSSAVCR